MQALDIDHLDAARGGQDTVHEREFSKGTAKTIPLRHQNPFALSLGHVGKGETQITVRNLMSARQGPQSPQHGPTHGRGPINRQQAKQGREDVKAQRF